jgi:copper(I)-binding protein
MTRRHTLSSVAAALLLLVGSQAGAQTSTVTVHDAWVREPMGGRNVTGAFAIVENSGATPRSIVSVSSDVSDKVELHEMKNEGGMMKMSMVQKLDIPARGTLELKPGSFHVMLFDVKTKLAEGGRVKLTLKLDDGSTVTTEAQVRKAGMMK